MEIKCEIRGIDKLITNVERLAEAKQAAVNALNTTAYHVRKQVRQEIVNAKRIDTNRLRDSWQVKEATTNSMVAKVGTTLARNDFQNQKYFPYAEVVESGAGKWKDGFKHTPPPIIDWVRRKGIATTERDVRRAAYFISKNFAENGQKGVGFFKKGTADTQKFLDARMKEVMAEVEAKWGT